MAIENSVSKDFWFTFVDSIYSFDCHLPGVIITYVACFCTVRCINIISQAFTVILKKMQCVGVE